MKDKEKQTEICERCKIKDNCSHRILIHMEKCKVNDCDCFQNISTDTVKQIEEMAKDSCEYCHIMFEEKECPTINENLCFAERLKEAIYYYNLGYRKIDKDNVVLSKEEWTSLKGKAWASTFKDAEILQLKEELKQSNKETAEKIIIKIKQFLSSVETVRGDDENKLYPEIGYKCSEVDDFLDNLENNLGLR